MIELESLVRPNIAALTPYSTARDELSGAPDIFLDANESPYDNGFNRYPDPHQTALKQRLSEIKGIPADRIFLGNGSDEAIDLVLRVFCEPGQDNIVAISPSYGMYEVAAATNDIAVRKVPLHPDFSLDEEALLAAADAHTKVLFLCSPNNPSGNAFPNAQILDIATRFKGIVVVDEAYIDFSRIPSLASRVDDQPNLIVLQTLSKAWGMAGLRVGLALACPRIVRWMSMIKYPYNINVLAQRTVLEQLRQPVAARIAEIIAERDRLAASLPALPFVRTVYPSEANFLLVKVEGADALYAHLLRDGIIVRNHSCVPGCEGCLRITVGTPEENRRLEASLKRYQP
ncbi:MAG: histidinol-phosphate transaminase [Bacteroidales bacterium]|nr:histidinol-phosphate transaminase [Bacteroidales bacterium]